MALSVEKKVSFSLKKTPFILFLTPFIENILPLVHYSFKLLWEGKNIKGVDWMDNIIEVKGLTKSFSKEPVLKNINFSVKKGETIGFLGPSGAGKTTIIKILTAQLQATSGEVKLFNQPVHRLKKPAYRKKIGIVTDNSSLYERLTIYDNLVLYCDLYGISKERIPEALDFVNLLVDQKKRIQELSKGMKQRVLLARAILHRPSLLFLDEPTSALDPVNMDYIHEGLKSLNREGVTIFLTTHHMEEADKLCDRVAFLNQGKIAILDTPQNIKLRNKTISVSLLLTNNEILTVDMDDQGADAICHHIKKREVLTLHSNEPSLGDVFVEITGRKL